MQITLFLLIPEVSLRLLVPVHHPFSLDYGEAHEYLCARIIRNSLRRAGRQSAYRRPERL